VLTLVLFAGTILIVDLRMLGVAFRKTPFSQLDKRILPLTILGFAIMIVTGVILFFSRPIETYYHSIWFRGKMVFLVIASINIFWFHYVVQKSQDEWDTREKMPWKVRASAIVSLTCWAIIICFGRFIPYNWFEADRVASMIRDSVIAKAQAEGKISEKQIAMALDRSAIPAEPKPHKWTMGDEAALAFFRSVYFLAEQDRERGPPPTLDSIIQGIEHRTAFMPKLPFQVAGEKDDAEIAAKCMTPEQRANQEYERATAAFEADRSEAVQIKEFEKNWPAVKRQREALAAFEKIIGPQPDPKKDHAAAEKWVERRDGEEGQAFIAKWEAEHPLIPAGKPIDPPPPRKDAAPKPPPSWKLEPLYISDDDPEVYGEAPPPEEPAEPAPEPAPGATPTTPAKDGSK
jgi:hypothetical protein